MQRRTKFFFDTTKFRRGLVAASCFFLLANAADASKEHDFVDIKLTPDVVPSQVPPGELRADAKEMAEILEIGPYVERLREAKRTGAPTTRALTNARMMCLWRIMTSAQEVRKMTGRIDRELASSNIALSQLMAMRNGTSNAINTLNFAQGGTWGILKQSFVLEHWFNTSQLPLIIGAGTGTALSIINLAHPYFWHRTADKTPNVLAHFLDENYKVNDAEVSYMWKFFCSPVPGSKFHNLTRRDIVIKHWEEYAGVTAKDEKKQRKLASNSLGDEKMKEGVKVIFQRITLLHDLKSHVEEIDASLFELHKQITSN